MDGSIRYGVSIQWTVFRMESDEVLRDAAACVEMQKRYAKCKKPVTK